MHVDQEMMTLGEKTTYCHVIQQTPGAAAGSSGSEPDDTWQQEQLADPDLKAVIQMKESMPNAPRVLDKLSPAVKRLLGQWNSIEVKEGILCRMRQDDDGLRQQIIVPRHKRPEILMELHSGTGGGHMGIHKLKEKVRERYYWHGWAEDSAIHCKECVTCASRKIQASPQKQAWCQSKQAIR